MKYRALVNGDRTVHSTGLGGRVWGWCGDQCWMQGRRLGPALEAEQEAGTSAGCKAGVSGRRLGPALDAKQGLVAGGWDQRWMQSRG